ncbi:MAG TPA: Amuc_1100 family pilus-like protein [Candidatus Baltobacteraceae bacterium]|jgi:hypothetical protein|nr:Amuc_1100 family pilus-like protein [Candidatus Baltobacteraceae bacterium]
MAWVKRNLTFVIIIAVGLIATGYCGYLLYQVVGANAAVSGDYSSTLQQLQSAQAATPPATKENIDAAKADQQRVQQFLVDFRKSFAPFPTAPKVDDRGFVEHLQLILRQFSLDATNSGVQLPPDYAFGFAQEKQKVSFSPECIGPWMQQLEEIRLILRILYTAKINYLTQIQRVPVCADDFSSGDDVLNTTSVSNQWGVVSPYKVTFRGFSTEVASVLAGFAGSTNCFLVKYLYVTPSREPLPQIIEVQQQPQMTYMPQPEYNPYSEGEGIRHGRGFRDRPQPRQPGEVLLAAPAAPTPPETILRETPLYVTIVVDAVNLKTPDR